MSKKKPQLVTLPHRTTLVQRAEVPMAEIGEAMGRMLPAVYAYMKEQDITPAGPPCSRWHGQGDPMDMECGMPIAGPAEPEAPFSLSELPGGRCAVVEHVGPYDQMPATWKALFAWVAEQELTPEASWEEYLTDPGQEPDSSKWRTKICVKVAD